MRNASEKERISSPNCVRFIISNLTRLRLTECCADLVLSRVRNPGLGDPDLLSIAAFTKEGGNVSPNQQQGVGGAPEPVSSMAQ